MSATPSLDGALLATGFPYDQARAAQFLLDLLGSLHDAHARGAAHGFAALDLCYVACGRVDAFWEFGLRPWDVAAGALSWSRPAGE